MTVNITLTSAEAQKIVEDKYRDLFFYPVNVTIKIVEDKNQRGSAIVRSVLETKPASEMPANVTIAENTHNRTSLSIIDALTLVTAARWAYAAQGGKNLINAVKEVRTLTGCGLKEAKDFCDALFGAI